MLARKILGLNLKRQIVDLTQQTWTNKWP